MNWTTDLPTEPGYYWLRGSDGLTVIEVYEPESGNGLGYIALDSGEYCQLCDLPKHDSDARFAGPLRPPEEE